MNECIECGEYCNSDYDYCYDCWQDVKEENKTYESFDENGYPIGDPTHSKLIHRQIAYSYIYLKNEDKYPKKFSEYIVHHIDSNKENFAIENLYICTSEQHNMIHDEQKRRLEKFKNPEEIDKFLKDTESHLKRLKELKRQSEKKRKKKTKKKVAKKRDIGKEELILKIKNKYKCLYCGRAINHKGGCLRCNIERKKEKERKTSWWRRFWN